MSGQDVALLHRRPLAMMKGAVASMSSIPELFEDVSMDEILWQLKKDASSLDNGSLLSSAVSTVATLADLPKYIDEEGERTGKVLAWTPDHEFTDDASASNSLDVLGDVDILWEDEELEEIMARQYSPDEPAHPTDITRELWGIQAMYSFGYDLLNCLAEGRASFVRRAKRCSDGVVIAVKSSRGQTAKDTLRGEFRILRKLHHSNIVKADALFESRFDLWMCMELCDAGMLESHVCDHGPLCEGASRPLFAQLLEAIDYIHGKEIVHTALLPRHVLLTDSALVLKICDFSHAEKVGFRIMAADAVLQRHRPGAVDACRELLARADWKKRLDMRACGEILCFMLQGTTNGIIERAGCGRGGDVHTFDINSSCGFTEPTLVPLSIIAHNCLAIGVAMRLTARGLLTTFFS